MSRSDSPRLHSLFRRIIAWRWAIVVLYAILFPAAIFLAFQVKIDNSIDRLVVKSDVDFLANRAFQRHFPEGEHIVLLAEAPDPFAPDVLQRVSEIEKSLGSVKSVECFSALTLYRRARPTPPGTLLDTE